jgi:hypothetical protein
MPAQRDARARAKEWRATREAQRRQDQRAKEALETVAGANLHNPMSLHPLRMFSPFPGAYTDSPADLSWNPLDVFGGPKREA